MTGTSSRANKVPAPDVSDDVDTNDVGAFLREFRNETDRGLALVSAAVIDEKLGEILAAFLQVDSDVTQRLLGSEPRREAPLSSFSARADATFALGLIDRDEYEEIINIRKIRNEFAHARHGTTFAAPKIQGLCRKLKRLPPKTEASPPKERFKFAVIEMYLRLYHRPRQVGKLRRQPRKWISAARIKWSDRHKAITLTLDLNSPSDSTVTIDFGV